ncbi:MAG: GAF domain-containing SpoIIE family protein phosphatase [Kiritimatiellia bacterium]|nr:GAF domain-containing SpoIIE family protein phosphatase [Kiritimatiellia bacterium]
MSVVDGILSGILLGLALTLAVAIRLLLRERRAKRFLLREKEVMFNFVHDVGEVFADSDTVDMEPLLEKALYYALRTTRAGGGAVYLYDSADTLLSARAIAGTFPPLVRRIETPMDLVENKSLTLEQWVRNQTVRRGEGLLGRVADFGQAELVPDAERDPRIPRHVDEWLRVLSLIAVPLRFRHRVMGVMVVVNPVDGNPFLENDLSLLQALADQASVSAHYVRLREELDAKRRIDNDLAVARRIQASLLPRRLPDYPGIGLAAFNIPALGVGGDYYDMIRIDEDHLGLAIADVSGKGVGGAILMSVCRSVLRARAPGCSSPAEVLRALNRALCEDLTEDMFVTASYLVLNVRTLELTVARAGHEPPWLWRAGADRPESLCSEGIALGLGGVEAFEAVLTETVTKLEAGDMLILLTDGIFEAQNKAGDEWGMAQLEEAIRPARDQAPDQMLESLRTRLMQFVGDAPPYDDMTMVALRIMQTPSV